MATLIYTINQPLDGYITGENGNFDWSEPSEDAHALFNDLQGSVGTSLLGRRMYETMRVWDTFDLDDFSEVGRGFAEAWRQPTRSSTHPPWMLCRNRGLPLERMFDPGVVEAMKDQADHDLSISGPGLATEAIRAGLVDRYVLRLIPIIVGRGTRALPDGAQVNLALNTTHCFDDGSVLVDYSLQ